MKYFNTESWLDCIKNTILDFKLMLCNNDAGL